VVSVLALTMWLSLHVAPKRPGEAPARSE